MAIWLPDKFGIDKRIINLSAQLMAGSVTKAEALEELSKPALTIEEKKQLTNYIIKKLDLNDTEYKHIWHSPNKTYIDYPNYEKLLYFILRFMKPLIKMVYRQLPMTFVEMEMNRNNKKEEL